MQGLGQLPADVSHQGQRQAPEPGAAQHLVQVAGQHLEDDALVPVVDETVHHGHNVPAPQRVTTLQVPQDPDLGLRLRREHLQALDELDGHPGARHPVERLDDLAGAHAPVTTIVMGHAGGNRVVPARTTLCR